MTASAARSRMAAALLVGALTAIGACMDDTGPVYTPPTQRARPPQTAAPAIGTFHVIVATTGTNPDSDGYALIVDDSIKLPVRANDTVLVSKVVIDQHTLRLDNIAPNCVPDTMSSRALNLTSTRDTTTQLAIKCLGSAVPPELAGTQLLFVRGGRIYRTSIGDGAAPAALAAGEEPALSPDGQRIAFVRNDNVYVMDADGANERLIAKGIPVPVPNNSGLAMFEIDAGREAVAWSPDGTRLALYSGSGIMIAPVDGAAPVHSDGIRSGSPAWSPDGRHVAFVVDTPDESQWLDIVDVYVGDVDGSGLSNVRKLTNASSSAPIYLQPAWSPDGKQIAMVACGKTGGYGNAPCAHSRIVVMNADGSQPRTLAYASGYSKPAWSPDGQTIAFANTCWNYDCPSAVLYVSIDGTREGVLIDDAHSPSLSR